MNVFLLRTLAVALAGALGLALHAGAAPDPDAMQTPAKFKRTARHALAAQYLLHLPRDYSPRGTNRWPLILFLHGAGERGTNLQQVAVHGPPRIVKSRPDFPFLVVSPQCPPDQIWDDELLLALLDDVIKHHKVDQRRVYLTGLSMGGYGTWSLALKHPARFAAAAPICGGGNTIDVLLASRTNAAALKKLPIRAFHGGKDTVVDVSESERMVNALKRAGARQVELIVYPEAGHDSWTETYSGNQLYDWFLSHRRE